MEEKRKITSEEIERFMEGRDPMERIVNLSYRYSDDFITIYYRDKDGRKCKTKDKFYPFIWATRDACLRLCHGDRGQLRRLMNKYSIGCKALRTTNQDGEHVREFEDGYTFMFFAKKPLSQKMFLRFFQDCGNPTTAKRDKDGNEIPQPISKSRQYLSVPPQEQYLISTGKRFFKGYDDYDDIVRMTVDIETGKVNSTEKANGLDPHKSRITDIGVRTNKGFEKLLKVTGFTKEEQDESELGVIRTLLDIISHIFPDVLTAHNGENFDWWYIIERCNELGHPMEELSKEYFGGESIRKDERETTLKLGGEVETYHATIIPEIIVTDSLHAVRRAQATDSNFIKADLKYSTKYLGIKKKNRVYIPGDKINVLNNDKSNKYDFNNEDGSWHAITPDKPLKEGHQEVTGEYIVTRYLMDDIWECDKVEHRLNTTNFLKCKMLPIPYKKCTTMGTAGQWKGLMMAWSYENGLAIPMFRDKKRFTGGLSRLLRMGYVGNVIKLDFNSLYPSIDLTWGISDVYDLTGVMLIMLEYVLTTREKYKGFKKKADKEKDRLEPLVMAGTATEEEIADYQRKVADFEFNDKKQDQMKVFGNSFFGSFGATNVFPWGSSKCAEQTTCTGRQCLRLMISHFSKLGFVPIVGDSVMPDTPLFIKYKDSGYIDIKPISEMMDGNSVKIDAYGRGREYDFSEKPYQVLCRSGWVDVKYVYRHETDKDIYRVTGKEGTYVDVTQDHSLFNSDKREIKPTDINNDTILESYEKEIKGDTYNTDLLLIGDPYALYKEYARMLAKGKLDRVPMKVLNSEPQAMKVFYETFMELKKGKQYSKTVLAGINYIKASINIGSFLV